MRYVAGISWPRSGHHLLERLLRSYFGDEFTYCEFYYQPGCCKTFPCSRPGVALSKNHDFDLDLPIPAMPTLVQYRDFLPSMASDYELILREGHADTRELFRRFALGRLRVYQGFLKKWVWPAQDRLIVKYEDLISAPESTLEQVVAHFIPGQHIDRDRLRKATAGAEQITGTKSGDEATGDRGIRQTRDISQHRHMDIGLIEEVLNQSLYQR